MLPTGRIMQSMRVNEHIYQCIENFPPIENICMYIWMYSIKVHISILAPQWHKGFVNANDPILLYYTKRRRMLYPFS